jgi:hypothetical protein
VSSKIYLSKKKNAGYKTFEKKGSISGGILEFSGVDGLINGAGRMVKTRRVRN